MGRPPAIIPTLNGTVRVMVAACNLVGCGPPTISQPFEVEGVERLNPEVGHPEDGSTVPAGVAAGGIRGLWRCVGAVSRGDRGSADRIPRRQIMGP